MERSLLGYQIVAVRGQRAGDILAGDPTLLWNISEVKAAIVLSVQSIPYTIIQVYSDGTREEISIE